MTATMNTPTPMNARGLLDPPVEPPPTARVITVVALGLRTDSGNSRDG